MKVEALSWQENEGGVPSVPIPERFERRVLPARGSLTRAIDDEVDIATTIKAIYPWAQRFALGLCRDHDEAADLLHDALLALVKRPPAPLNEATARSWLRVVLVRTYSRRIWHVRREVQAWIRRASNPEPEPQSKESHSVLEILHTLAPRQRACVLLFYLEDLSVEAIAEQLGVRPGTVKAHLAQARDRLRNAPSVSSLP